MRGVHCTRSGELGENPLALPISRQLSVRESTNKGIPMEDSAQKKVPCRMRCNDRGQAEEILVRTPTSTGELCLLAAIGQDVM